VDNYKEEFEEQRFNSFSLPYRALKIHWKECLGITLGSSVFEYIQNLNDRHIFSLWYIPSIFIITYCILTIVFWMKVKKRT